MDKIKVGVRIRPLIQSEIDQNLRIHWDFKKNAIFQIDPNNSKIINNKYIFDYIFNEKHTNETVFANLAKPILDSVIEGYNGTIFAYGQTSSGKTHTMNGNLSDEGIIPKAIKYVFKKIHSNDRTYLLRVSYLEIYNEIIIDLLSKKKCNKIRENLGNVVVVDLQEEVADCPQKIFDLLAQGNKNRQTAETAANEKSSRSHAIFRITIESRGENDDFVESQLNFVDLAGSEKTDFNTGNRLKEGCAINKSLFILSKVISQLSEQQETGQYISYRDSKLTRILQNSLGGNSLTAIICAITPTAIDETVSTLGFALRAKKILNNPSINEIVSEQALLKKFQQEIESLQTKLNEKDQVNSYLIERFNLLKNKILGAPSVTCKTNPLNFNRRMTWHKSHSSTTSNSPRILNTSLLTLKESSKLSDTTFLTPIEQFDSELRALEERNNRKSTPPRPFGTSLVNIRANMTFNTPKRVLEMQQSSDRQSKQENLEYVILEKDQLIEETGNRVMKFERENNDLKMELELLRKKFTTRETELLCTLEYYQNFHSKENVEFMNKSEIRNIETIANKKEEILKKDHKTQIKELEKEIKKRDESLKLIKEEHLHMIDEYEKKIASLELNLGHQIEEKNKMQEKLDSSEKELKFELLGVEKKDESLKLMKEEHLHMIDEHEKKIASLELNLQHQIEEKNKIQEKLDSSEKELKFEVLGVEKKDESLKLMQEEHLHMIDEYEKKIASLELNLGHQIEEKNKIQEKLDSSEKEKDLLKLEIEKINFQLNKLNEEKNQIQENVLTMDKEKINLQQSLGNLKSELHKSLEQNKLTSLEYENKYKNLENEYLKHLNELQLLENRKDDSLMGDLKLQIDILENEKNQLKNDYQWVLETKQEKIEIIGEKEEEINQLKTEIKKLSMNIQELYEDKNSNQYENIKDESQYKHTSLKVQNKKDLDASDHTCKYSSKLDLLNYQLRQEINSLGVKLKEENYSDGLELLKILLISVVEKNTELVKCLNIEFDKKNSHLNEQIKKYQFELNKESNIRNEIENLIEIYESDIKKYKEVLNKKEEEIYKLNDEIQTIIDDREKIVLDLYNEKLGNNKVVGNLKKTFEENFIILENKNIAQEKCIEDLQQTISNMTKQNEMIESSPKVKNDWINKSTNQPKYDEKGVQCNLLEENHLEKELTLLKPSKEMKNISQQTDLQDISKRIITQENLAALKENIRKLASEFLVDEKDFDIQMNQKFKLKDVIEEDDLKLKFEFEKKSKLSLWFDHCRFLKECFEKADSLKMEIENKKLEFKNFKENHSNCMINVDSLKTKLKRKEDYALFKEQYQKENPQMMLKEMQERSQQTDLQDISIQFLTQENKSENNTETESDYVALNENLEKLKQELNKLRSGKEDDVQDEIELDKEILKEKIDLENKSNELIFNENYQILEVCYKENDSLEIQLEKINSEFVIFKESHSVCCTLNNNNNMAKVTKSQSEDINKLNKEIDSLKTKLMRKETDYALLKDHYKNLVYQFTKYQKENPKPKTIEPLLDNSLKKEEEISETKCLQKIVSNLKLENGFLWNEHLYLMEELNRDKDNLEKQLSLKDTECTKLKQSNIELITEQIQLKKTPHQTQQQQQNLISFHSLQLEIKQLGEQVKTEKEISQLLLKELDHIKSSNQSFINQKSNKTFDKLIQTEKSECLQCLDYRKEISKLNMNYVYLENQHEVLEQKYKSLYLKISHLENDLKEAYKNEKICETKIEELKDYNERLAKLCKVRQEKINQLLDEQQQQQQEY